MTIDWHAMRQEWIARVRAELFPHLLADTRFKSAVNLTGRFNHEIDVWSKTDSFNPVIEIGNELSAAECLLRSLGDRACLMYEPSIAGTKKKIDFLTLSASGQHEWVEVKTVAPQWVDDEPGWQRFIQIAQAFPENARLGVVQEWAGAALAGQAIKARWSFVQRTVEVEERAAVIPEAQKGPVWLLLCSTGLAWDSSELEDFADFYRRGKPRSDDYMRNAMAQYMRDAGITLRHTLSGFHYLARKHDNVFAHDFRMNVVGPAFGS